MIESVVSNRLANFAGLSALVGTGASARIYPMKIPQNAAMPAIAYQVVSATRHSAMGADTGLTEKRVQVSSFGTTYADVKAVSEQVRAALQRWSGVEPITGITVHETFIENDRDLYDDQTKELYVVQDFRLTFVEA